MAGLGMLILSIILRLGLRFKLAAGLGQPWTRDGGIPQGCLLSMMLLLRCICLGVSI